MEVKFESYDTKHFDLDDKWIFEVTKITFLKGNLNNFNLNLYINADIVLPINRVGTHSWSFNIPLYLPYKINLSEFFEPFGYSQIEIREFKLKNMSDCEAIIGINLSKN